MIMRDVVLGIIKFLKNRSCTIKIYCDVYYNFVTIYTPTPRSNVVGVYKLPSSRVSDKFTHKFVSNIKKGKNDID